ncbi:hypothetical protein BDW42DRAFT_164510 [Aspergillus taichungensis]|uniref:Kelch repeat protein n=1 Tax=Aspergillus taichungensis TaxID=482145 RepID=A0A2J5I1M3_9EURO|nr:hypothetical protein BDW42DRAFT_164510 [Aspergillus taichungensis]
MPQYTWLAVSLWAALAYGFGPSWTGNQVNLSIHNWDRLRVITIRDTVYLNGGLLQWQQEFSDDDPRQRPESTQQANVYYFQLNETFDTSTSNLTALLRVIPATGVQIPTYMDGAMLGNDEKFYFYGGLMRRHEDEPLPAEDTILQYERYQYGPPREGWESGLHTDKLNDVTMYVSSGASVSAPSENLGFYFGGMRADNWGPLTYGDSSSLTESDNFITVDMSEMRDNRWANRTLPEYVAGRAYAEVVWVPVSEQGVVVVLGGVVNPAAMDGYSPLNKEETSESKRVSPGFMESVSVYDIAEQKWYIQNTTGDIPPQLARFCSVYASAQDDSSHNIYIYGGNDGIDPTEIPSDDVYVLSLPSFEWIKLYSGVKEHGRSGHRCVKPHPDQMLVLGGLYKNKYESLGGGFIQVLNLTTGRFQNTYDPGNLKEYRVPDMVVGRIGGSPTGGATKTSPKSWTNDSLASVFSKKYPGSIKTWYPYLRVLDKKGSKFPGWAGAIIGVVLGVILIACALAFWLVRRRRKQRGYRSSHNPSISEPDTSTMTRVARWIWSDTDGDNSRPKSVTEYGAPSEGTAVSQRLPEVEGEPVHELPQDTTKVFPAELPTPYNVHSGGHNPASSPAPSSTAGGYRSPVSPEPPGEEGNYQEEGRPTHGRQMSNVSSAPSMSIADVISEDGEKNTKGHAMRPSIVSNVSEMSSTPSSFSEQGTWAGLGINSEGKLSPTREDKE